MKKLLLISFIAVICASAFAGGGGDKTDPLDLAIRETSDYLNANLTSGVKLAFVNIQSDYAVFSEYIIDELITNTVNDRIFTVVDRQQLDAIRAELDFQMSGEVDDKTAQELGRLAGAQTIVTGSLTKIGSTYRLRVRALNVQSAQIEGQHNANIPDTQLVKDLIQASGGTTQAQSGASSSENPSIIIVNNTGNTIHEIGLMVNKENPAPDEVRRFINTVSNGQSVTIILPFPLRTANEYFITIRDNVGFNVYAKIEKVSANKRIEFTSRDRSQSASETLASRSGNTPTNTSTPSTSGGSYKVGDTGPAGGIIFYDKGNNNGGWRYLEAAPVDIEFQAKWSVRYTAVDGTQETIGSGKRNTQLIVDILNQTSGEWDTAAQKCVELNFGGFNDWFVPSRAELDQMYGQLKRRNLGDFKNSWYWTSTQSGKNYAHRQYFEDGRQLSQGSKDNSNYVRPIRQF